MVKKTVNARLAANGSPRTDLTNGSVGAAASCRMAAFAPDFLVGIEKWTQWSADIGDAFFRRATSNGEYMFGPLRNGGPGILNECVFMARRRRLRMRRLVRRRNNPEVHGPFLTPRRIFSSGRMGARLVRSQLTLAIFWRAEVSAGVVYPCAYGAAPGLGLPRRGHSLNWVQQARQKPSFD